MSAASTFVDFLIRFEIRLILLSRKFGELRGIALVITFITALDVWLSFLLIRKFPKL